MALGIKPRLFASLAVPISNSNFEFYSQKDGNMRKASADQVRDYMSADWDATPLGFVPTATGNTTNLNEFRLDSEGNLWFIDRDGDGLKFQLYIDAGDIDYDLTDGYVPYYKDSVDKLEDSPIFYDNATSRVGYFTAAPNYSFHMFGDMAVENGSSALFYLIGGNSFTNSSIYFGYVGDESKHEITREAFGDDLYIGLDSAEVMRMQIGGQIIFSQYGVETFNTGTSATYPVFDSIGYVYERTAAELAAELGASGGGLWSSNVNGIYVTDLTDFVGIGTASPDYQLHVVSGTGSDASLVVQNTGGAIADDAHIRAIAAAGGGEAKITFQRDAYGFTLGVDNNGVDAWYLATGNNLNSKLISVLSSGEVGIGVVTPLRHLHIKETNGTTIGIRIEEDTSTTGYKWDIYMGANDDNLYIKNITNDGVFTEFKIRDSSNNDRLEVSMSTGELTTASYGSDTITGVFGTFAAWDTSGRSIELSAADVVSELSAELGNTIYTGDDTLDGNREVSLSTYYMKFTNTNYEVAIKSNGVDLLYDDGAGTTGDIKISPSGGLTYGVDDGTEYNTMSQSPTGGWAVIAFDGTYLGTIKLIGKRFEATGQVARSGKITATITTDQDDFAPTGYVTTYIIEIDNGANNVAITGLNSAHATQGTTYKFKRLGSGTVTLMDEDAGSAAANRFDGNGSDKAINVLASVVYDTDDDRWLIED